MATFNKILETNEKKLDISDFIPENMKDEESDWITIKKLPRIVKTKLRFLNQNMYRSQKGKEVMKVMQKKLKEKGLKIEDLDKMEPNEQYNLYVSFNLDTKDYEYMGENTAVVEKYILEHGVDPLKHSFKDEKGKSIRLDSNVWDCMPDKLITYIVNGVKVLSKGFSLGE